MQMSSMMMASLKGAGMPATQSRNNKGGMSQNNTLVTKSIRAAQTQRVKINATINNAASKAKLLT
jgi:hypothetical protein